MMAYRNLSCPCDACYENKFDECENSDVCDVWVLYDARRLPGRRDGVGDRTKLQRQAQRLIREQVQRAQRGKRVCVMPGASEENKDNSFWIGDVIEPCKRAQHVDPNGKTGPSTRNGFLGAGHNKKFQPTDEVLCLRMWVRVRGGSHDLWKMMHGKDVTEWYVLARSVRRVLLDGEFNVRRSRSSSRRSSATTRPPPIFATLTHEGAELCKEATLMRR